MSASLNKVTLIGNLGQDPEVRHTQAGGSVVTFSVATTKSWKDSNNGERRERTEWHRIVVFAESLGRIVEKHLTKGAKVYVEGQLRTRKWTDQAGQDRYTTEVHLTPYNGTITFLSAKPVDERTQRREPARAGGGSGHADDPGMEDVPF